MFTPKQRELITGLMSRTEYVQTWPEDEIELHRNGFASHENPNGWRSFSERNEQVIQLRLDKIERISQRTVYNLETVSQIDEWQWVAADAGCWVKGTFPTEEAAYTWPEGVER